MADEAYVGLYTMNDHFQAHLMVMQSLIRRNVAETYYIAF